MEKKKPKEKWIPPPPRQPRGSLSNIERIRLFGRAKKWKLVDGEWWVLIEEFGEGEG